MVDFPEISAGNTLTEAIEALRQHGVKTAHVGIFDTLGMFRERRMPLTDAPTVMDDGGTFVNVLPSWDANEQLISSGPFVGEPVSIDPETIRPYPFEDNACLMVADYTGLSSNISPRTLLQQQVGKASELGFDVQCAIESEFIVLNEEATSLRQSDFSTLDTFAKDNRCWSGISAATHADFVKQLEQVLRDGGLDLLALSLELGPGCFESTLRHTTPLKAAEDHLLLKMYTKAFCRQRGLTASFMAQLGSGFPGLSQHPHVSLLHSDSQENAFIANTQSTNSPFGMSKACEHFIAGLITMIPEAMALTHSTPNSYRRLAPGNWAPKSASWARQNYSAAVRVITQPNSHARLEYRLPGADANPFLNLSFVLGAGLWGIENEIPLPAEFTGGGPDDMPDTANLLPHDLLIATNKLETSNAAAEIWGAEFIQHFVAFLKAEESVLRGEVSNVERARYLEIV